jgi:hypothetical protein
VWGRGGEGGGCGRRVEANTQERFTLLAQHEVPVVLANTNRFLTKPNDGHLLHLV